MDKLNGHICIENDDFFKKYNTIWDKVSADIKTNVIVSLFFFFKRESGFKNLLFEGAILKRYFLRKKF